MKTVYIRIGINTKKRLGKLGIKDSTYDSIISELLDHGHICDHFWSERI